MFTQRITGLTLLNIHSDISVEIPAAVDEFIRRHPRRLQMQDIATDFTCLFVLFFPFPLSCTVYGYSVSSFVVEITTIIRIILSYLVILVHFTRLS